MTNSGWKKKEQIQSNFKIISCLSHRISSNHEDPNNRWVHAVLWKKKGTKRKKEKKTSTKKQVGPPVNGCRGIISNHHRNITSDLCTSKPRRKNITQLVNDVTLNRKESGNDARRSKRPGEKKNHVSLSWVLAHFFVPCSCVKAHNISFFALRHSLLFHYQRCSLSSRERTTREMINHFFSSLNCYKLN